MGSAGDLISATINPILAQANMIADVGFDAILPKPPSTAIKNADMPVPGAPAKEAGFTPGLTDAEALAKKRASLKKGKKQFISPLAVDSSSTSSSTQTGLKI